MIYFYILISTKSMIIYLLLRSSTFKDHGNRKKTQTYRQQIVERGLKTPNKNQSQWNDRYVFRNQGFNEWYLIVLFFNNVILKGLFFLLCIFLFIYIGIAVVEITCR